MSDDKEITMSIEETNALRISLGLKPLNDTKKKEVTFINTSTSNEMAVKERLEKSKVMREERAKANKKNKKSLGEDSSASDSAADWVKQSRLNALAKKATPAPTSSNTSSNKNKKEEVEGEEYSSSDLQGLNVAHSMEAFESGEDVILTLGDTSILETGENGMYTGLNEEGSKLENVNLAEQERVRKAKRKKSKLDAMKYSGGYDGFDDDEFEELGGRQGPSNGRDTVLKKYDSDEGEDSGKGHGFTLTGSVQSSSKAGDEKSDFEKQANGGVPLSLQQDYGVASDFMTEEEAMKTKGFKKKKKEKKSKKESKKRKVAIESDDEDSGLNSVNFDKFKKKAKKSVLSSLLASGAVESEKAEKRKSTQQIREEKAAKKAQMEADRLEKFHETMAKGNERSKANVVVNKKEKVTKDVEMEDVDEETVVEDAGLKAAMAKAERMKKLKAIRAKKAGGGKTDVAKLVKESANAVTATGTTMKGDFGKTDGMTFDFGTTAEFARKLGTKIEEQKVQEKEKTSVEEKKKKEDAAAVMSMEEMEEMAKGIQSEEDMMAKLAAMDEGSDADAEEEGEVEEDADVAGEMLGLSNPAGRGMSSILSMLKSTGDLTNKRAGKEELRGRAKDEKTYDDYSATNLDSVVRIDKKKATKKDVLYSKKEINLEYRDEFGRLLTRKEAFRQLCYQFHGYGSGKKNQEKRLKKIKLENEAREKRINEDKGTMGSLRKTQQATGKAFVIHKT
ncbi:hypothetical protein TrST_g5862 [Triparma strigata]|uniref:SART-1 family protein n=1 Tax=Triparma strigata TaxID=1606541 RepID=A0A9W7EMY7_9STRA|nr:hypothetical protein TrST_g5862 [Triparma strigata]